MDLAVGLADQALELGEGGLEVGALRLEALDVLERLLVLALGERVDGPELLAPAREALELGLDLGPLLVAERLLGGPELAAEGRAQLRQLRRGLGTAVAEVGEPDLGLR